MCACVCRRVCEERERPELMVWDKRRRGVESVSVRVAVGRRSYLELLLVPLDQLPHGLRHPASVVGERVRACRREGTSEIWL